MDTNGWIISVSSGSIAALVSAVAYFAHKWMEGVDARIQKHGEKTDKLSEHIQGLKTEIQRQAAEIPSRIARAYETSDKAHHRNLTDRLVESSSKIQRIEMILRDKTLPQADQLKDITGRVVVLESTLDRFVSSLKARLKP